MESNSISIAGQDPRAWEAVRRHLTRVVVRHVRGGVRVSLPDTCSLLFEEVSCAYLSPLDASKKLPHPCSCVQTLGLHTLLLVPWEELWPCRRVEGKPPLKKGFQQGSDCPVWIIGALCSLKALSLALSVFLVLWIFMFVLGQKVSMPGFFAAYNHNSILLNT